MNLREIFLTVLSMSMTGSMVIGFVLPARLLLRKAPKIFSYALWAVVLFRLLCPVSVSSALSLLNFTRVPVEASGGLITSVDYAPVIDEYIDAASAQTNAASDDPLVIPENREEVMPTPDAVINQAAAEPVHEPICYAVIIWLVGLGVMLLCNAVSCIRLFRRLTGAVHLRKNIYLGDHIPTPFVLGIVKPRIYLPSTLDVSERRYIIAHERRHIRRKDHIVRLLAYLALCLHWFNPLVWLAFTLSGKDMEMSCDEAVIRMYGPKIRAEYATSLLRLTTGRRSFALTPLAFGEGDTKGRVLNMAKWKKPGFWATICALILCACVLAACAMNPSLTPVADDSKEDAGSNETVYEDIVSTEAAETEAPLQPRREIHASTVDELIAAIGPNTEIILDAELYDFSTAAGYGTSEEEYYFWEDIHDGPGLVIRNVDNMVIRSSDGNAKAHTLAAVPRYADVLRFQDCSNIAVSGLTAGHTQAEGSCTGGVLDFSDSDHILVENCGLFGCGTLGVETASCTDITVKNCEIYECSEGGVKMRETTGIRLEGTTFRDIGGRNYIWLINCSDAQSDGEILISADGKGSLEVATPGQQQRNALDAIVHDFANFYFFDEQERMEEHLAESYSGSGKTHNTGESNNKSMYFEVTHEQVAEIDEKGSCTIRIPYRPVQGSDDIAYLLVTVVKENGEYKISDYELQE